MDIKVPLPRTINVFDDWTIFNNWDEYSLYIAPHKDSQIFLSGQSLFQSSEAWQQKLGASTLGPFTKKRKVATPKKRSGEDSASTKVSLRSPLLKKIKMS